MFITCTCFVTAVCKRSRPGGLGSRCSRGTLGDGAVGAASGAEAGRATPLTAPVPKAYLQKCVLRAMPEGGTGPLLTMSALSEVQAYISNFWSGPKRTLPTRRLYP